MSRIDTQQDRLVQGPRSFQFSERISPARITPQRTDTVSKLISSLNTAAGTISKFETEQERKRRVAAFDERTEEGRARAAQERERVSAARAEAATEKAQKKLDKAQFNVLTSELNEVGSQLEADPNNKKLQSLYSNTRDSTIDVLGGDSTDFGAAVSKGSFTDTDIGQMGEAEDKELIAAQRVVENDLRRDASDARVAASEARRFTNEQIAKDREINKQLQGGYQREVDLIVAAMMTDQMISDLAELDGPARFTAVLNYVSETIGKEALGKFDGSSLDHLISKAVTASGGDAKTLYNERQQLAKDNGNNLSFNSTGATIRALYNPAIDALNIDPQTRDKYIEGLIQEQANAEGETDEVMLDKYISAQAQDLANQLAAGTPDSRSKSFNTLLSLPSISPENMAERIKGAEDMASFEAETQSAAMSHVVDQEIADDTPKEEARNQIHKLGLSILDDMFGARPLQPGQVSPTSIDAWSPTNEIEAAFKESILSASKTKLQEFSTAKDKKSDYLATMFDPTSATPSDITQMLNMDLPERQAFLNTLIAGYMSLDVPTEGYVEHEAVLDTLVRAKTSTAAWYEVIGTQMRGSDKYGQVFSQTVGRILDKGDAISLDEMRQVMSFVGNDLDEVKFLFDNEAQINSLSLTMADLASSVGGEINVLDAYQGHMRDFQSIRIRGEGEKRGEGSITADKLFDDKAYVRALTNTTKEDNITFDKFTKETLMSILNISHIDPGRNNTTEAMGKASLQVMKELDYSMITLTTTSGKKVVSFNNHTSTPEAVGLVTEDVRLGIQQRDSGVDRYVGALLSETGTNTFGEHVFAKLESNPNIFDNPVYADVLNVDAVYSHFKKGDMRIFVDSASATQNSVPIYVQLLDKGQNPIAIPLGSVDFSDPQFRRGGPDWWKSPKPVSIAPDVVRQSDAFEDIQFGGKLREFVKNRKGILP